MMLKNLTRPTGERDNGFTMIEILVVIIIIGILAAIAIPIFLNQRKAAWDTALTSDVRNVALTYQTWRASVGNDDKALNALAKHNRGYAIFAADDAVYNRGTTAMVWNNQDELPKTTLSDGTFISLRTPAVESGEVPVEGKFCLIGTNPYSNYNYENGDGPLKYHTRMFYDSGLGGLRTIEELAAAYKKDPSAAACNTDIEAYIAATG